MQKMPNFPYPFHPYLVMVVGTLPQATQRVWVDTYVWLMYFYVMQYTWCGMPHEYMLYGIDATNSLEAMYRLQYVMLWLLGISLPHPNDQIHISPAQAEYFVSQILYSIFDNPDSIAWHKEKAHLLASIVQVDENYIPLPFPDFA